MKKIILLLLILLPIIASAQTYQPSKGNPINKPMAPGTRIPVDSRSMFYDTTNLLWRPYQSTAEVLSYLVNPISRFGNFSIFVNATGVLQPNGTFVGGTITEWWFKNGVTNGDLVQKATSQIDSSRTPTYVKVYGVGGTDSARIYPVDGFLAGVATPVMKAQWDSSVVNISGDDSIVCYYRANATLIFCDTFSRTINAMAPVRAPNQYTVSLNQSVYSTAVKQDSLISLSNVMKSYVQFRTLPAAQADTGVVIWVQQKKGKYRIPFRYDPDDASTADDSATCIVTATGQRFKLVVTDYVQPYMFGSYPDDGVDDQAPLQKMIDWLVYNTRNIRTAIFEGGLYELSNKGILVWKDANNDGNPEQVQISLLGAKTVGVGSAGGETQLYGTFNDGFILGAQRCKGCEFSNLYISGLNQLNYGLDSSWNKDATFLMLGYRNNRYSPSAGICLDPFGTVEDSTTDRYPDWNVYYRNIIGGGGSTLVIMRNNRIDGVGAVGIMLTPNMQTQNNEGHWIENSWFTNVRTAYASTNSQERTVQIINCYAWGSIRTVFDTRTYGDGAGEPPSINGINIAGGVYQAINFQGAGGFFPDVNVTNLYAELLFRLGISTAGTVFLNAHVAFGDKEEYYIAYPALRTLRYPDTLYYGGNTTFINPLLVYYNGGNKACFNFSGNIKFIGGGINSQPGVRYNTISVQPLNISMDGTGFYASGNGTVNNDILQFEAGDWSSYGTTQWMQYNQMYLPWINPPLPLYQVDYATQRRTAVSGLWKRGFIGDGIVLTVSGDSATATITKLANKTYLVNELVWSTESAGGHVMRIRRITGSTVCFDYLTESISASGTYNGLYIETMQKIERPIIADVSGGTSFTNVRLEYQTTPYTMPIGMYFLNDQMFFVTASGAGTATVENFPWTNVSRAVIGTMTYQEDGFSALSPLDNSFFSDGVIFKKGGVFKNSAPGSTESNISSWECTVTGMKGDATVPPEFKINYRYAGGLEGVSVTSSRAALSTDYDKLVYIDNTSGNVTYTINPSTFANRAITIRASIPGSNTITITPSSGTIEGAASYGMADTETIRVWSNGTNLFILGKN